MSCTKLHLELRKLKTAIKTDAAVITAAAESRFWLGPDLAMETSSRSLITSIVVIYLLLCIFRCIELFLTSYLPALVPMIIHYSRRVVVV